MSEGVILSLFDRTGVMVKPWLEAGYRCMSGERKVYPDAGVTFTIGDGDGGATAHPA